MLNPAPSSSSAEILPSTSTSPSVWRMTPVIIFRRVDLPAFGAPAMAIGTPSLRACPVRNEEARRSISVRADVQSEIKWERSANSTSSSEKSSSSSSSDASSIICSRRVSSRRENTPFICVVASRWAAREDAAIMSAIPSA